MSKVRAYFKFKLSAKLGPDAIEAGTWLGDASMSMSSSINSKST